MSLIKLKDKIDTPIWNKDILILGCGPSLNDFSQEQLSSISKLDNHKIVIAIKQAIYHYPLSDILICNTCNLSDYYEYLIGDHWDTHSIFQISYPEMPYYNITKYDTILPIGQNVNYQQSLAVNKDLEQWSFKNSPTLRKWGPGILAETVLYLCEYLGAKNIYTIGVDGGPQDSLTRNHFYSNKKVFNIARPLELKESEKEIELMDCFYDWLQSKGINWYIASENCYFSNKIPRVKL